MVSTCIECGNKTHGTAKICYSCLGPEEYGDEFAQSTVRRKHKAPYAEAQEERIKALMLRVPKEMAQMRAEGLDPNKDRRTK